MNTKKIVSHTTAVPTGPRGRRHAPHSPRRRSFDAVSRGGGVLSPCQLRAEVLAVLG